MTAGNASKINDGAAALVLTTAAEAARRRPQAARPHRRPLLAAPRSRSGSPPPRAGAVRLALERAGLKAADIDLWEINEAFAVVAMAFLRDLELPADRVNVRGGAVSLGHPIGASGARILVTLLHAHARARRPPGLRRDLHRRRRGYRDDRRARRLAARSHARTPPHRSAALLLSFCLAVPAAAQQSSPSRCRSARRGPRARSAPWLRPRRAGAPWRRTRRRTTRQRRLRQRQRHRRHRGDRRPPAPRPPAPAAPAAPARRPGPPGAGPPARLPLKFAGTSRGGAARAGSHFQRQVRHRPGAAGPAAAARRGSAANLEYKREDYAVLSGDVQLKYQDLDLKADEVEIDLTTKDVIAIGNVILDQGPRRLSGDSLTFNLETKTGTISNATGQVAPDYYFRGEEVEKTGADTYVIHNGVFTSCSQPVPDWSFRVTEAEIEVKGYAHAHSASMRVKKLPVFYTPVPPLAGADRAQLGLPDPQHRLLPAARRRARARLLPDPGPQLRHHLPSRHLHARAS